jgi:putative hemolysin
MEDKIQKIVNSAKEYCLKNGIQWSAWQEQLILQMIEETFLICKK